MNGEVRLLLCGLMPEDINQKSLQESSISFPFPFPFFSSVIDVSFLSLPPSFSFIDRSPLCIAHPVTKISSFENPSPLICLHLQTSKSITLTFTIFRQLVEAFGTEFSSLSETNGILSKVRMLPGRQNTN